MSNSLLYSFPKGEKMPEYESSTHHLSVSDRKAMYGFLILWLIPTVVSYIVAGDIWLSRLMLYMTLFFSVFGIWAFIDTRIEAKRCHDRKRIVLAERNYFVK